jgi:hypothetical protein
MPTPSATSAFAAFIGGITAAPVSECLGIVGAATAIGDDDDAAVMGTLMDSTYYVFVFGRKGRGGTYVHYYYYFFFFYYFYNFSNATSMSILYNLL